MQNFGARDPFAAEVESNFCEKVLGNFDTEHIIKCASSLSSCPVRSHVVRFRLLEVCLEGCQSHECPFKIFSQVSNTENWHTMALICHILLLRYSSVLYVVHIDVAHGRDHTPSTSSSA
jgi:hypothetical protein